MTALAASLWAPSVLAQPTPGAHAQGRILVMPQAGLPDAALTKLARENGASNARRIGRTELRVIELPPGQEAAMVNRLARNPHIKFAELDMQVSESLVTNDPYLSSQWHHSKINSNAAWDLTQGNGVTIAILDSGIDTKHPDFGTRLVAGYNFVDGNTNVEDVRSHGTKVAGAAAAASNNGIGVAAVAGAAKVMPVRVSNADGYVYWSDMAAGLTWAADRGARVANMSFNGVAGSSSVLSAAKYFMDKGGLVFVSAGNDNKDPGYADTPYMIIVAATDKYDGKASFSNYGDHVDLSAPGSGIYTTTWSQTYASVSGTSFSAPIAAGVAALVMAANPNLSNLDVQKILFSTAVDLGTSGKDIHFGHGRLDAAAAVAAALKTSSTGSTSGSTSGSTTSDTTAPVAAISAPLASSTVSGLVPVGVSATDNVGVAKVVLRVNGTLVATDTTSPFGFSWDSTKVANGMASLSATAYDAAGNAGKSETVSVNVANSTSPTTTTDATPPSVTISSPTDGSKVNGFVTIGVSASDNSGYSGIRTVLYIDGRSVASATGGSLSYKWDARKVASGTHRIEAVSTDAAGNSSRTSVSVRK